MSAVEKAMIDTVWDDLLVVRSHVAQPEEHLELIVHRQGSSARVVLDRDGALELLDALARFTDTEELR